MSDTLILALIAAAFVTVVLMGPIHLVIIITLYFRHRGEYFGLPAPWQQLSWQAFPIMLLSLGVCFFGTGIIYVIFSILS